GIASGARSWTDLGSHSGWTARNAHRSCMAAQPTGRPGVMRIPAPSATRVAVRFAPLAQRDTCAPQTWPVLDLTRSAPAFPGWWEIDLDALGLADGPYEYEFVLDDRA